MFVNAFRLVTPVFVKAECEVVPFKTLASAACVAYVLEAAEVVKYELREDVKAYEPRDDDSAYELRVLVRLLLVTYEPSVVARADDVT